MSKTETAICVTTAFNLRHSKFKKKKKDFKMVGDIIDMDKVASTCIEIRK